MEDGLAEGDAARGRKRAARRGRMMRLRRRLRNARSSTEDGREGIATLVRSRSILVNSETYFETGRDALYSHRPR